MKSDLALPTMTISMEPSRPTRIPIWRPVSKLQRAMSLATSGETTCSGGILRL